MEELYNYVFLLSSGFWLPGPMKKANVLESMADSRDMGYCIVMCWSSLINNIWPKLLSPGHSLWQSQLCWAMGLKAANVPGAGCQTDCPGWGRVRRECAACVGIGRQESLVFRKVRYTGQKQSIDGNKKCFQIWQLEQSSANFGALTTC